MTKKNDELRNIALIAHSGAGKTSLSEIMLFKAGIINRIGSIEEGNTVMDFEPEEIKRQSSLSSSFYNFVWNKKLINLIDTPGDQNFISDTKLCLEASDSAVLVIDSVDGVKVQTEIIWDFAKKFELPCLIFINKMDKERADFFRTLKDIKKSLAIKPLVIELPIFKDGILKGIVDLINKKALIYDNNGNFKETNIPTDMKDDVNTYREKLIENIAEHDDTLIEKYLDGQEFSIDEIKKLLKIVTTSKSFSPVLCGSAIKKIGIDPLLNYIIDIFQSSTKLKQKKGIDPSNNKILELNSKSEEPFSAFVFKTVTDPYAGKLSIFKILSGKLEKDGVLYNSSKITKERFNQLLTIIGKDQKPINYAGPGSIVAVSKLKETKTGDTLCTDSKKIIYNCTKPLPTLISFAIVAKNKEDKDKVFTSLTKILEDDTSLKLKRNSETKEILLSGLGQIHIETTIDRLKRKYNVEVLLKTPKIPYRETIKKKVRVQGRHKKQSGGHGQFGDCWITLEPLPRGSGFEFVDAIVGGAIPKQYIPAVEKGIIEASNKGVLTGSKCVDFKATCDFGSYHPVDSSEMAFKIAGSIAYKKACEEANPIILEPLMKIKIIAPEEFTGDIMGDLNSKRGKVLGIETSGKNQMIFAEIPLAEIQLYASELRSITAGRGMFSVNFFKYDEVPQNLSEKIINNIKKYN